MALGKSFRRVALAVGIGCVSVGAGMTARGVADMGVTPDVVACMAATAQDKDCPDNQAAAVMTYERAPLKAALGCFVVAIGISNLALNRKRPSGSRRFLGA